MARWAVGYNVWNAPGLIMQNAAEYIVTASIGTPILPGNVNVTVGHGSDGRKAAAAIRKRGIAPEGLLPGSMIDHRIARSCICPGRM